MILLDAYPLVALLADEPAAGEVEELLRAGGGAVTVVNLAEVIDILQRVYGIAPLEARTAIEPLLAERLGLRPMVEEDAWRAAEIRLCYYDRQLRPLSLADCFLLAAARSDDRIATSDPPVAEVARTERIGLVPLPDSAGRRP